MKILLDLQGVQASGRFRGVGRYSLSLAAAMLAQPRGHEFWVLVNGVLRESADQLTEALASLIPRSRILALSVPGPVQELEVRNLWRTRAAEILRESAVASLNPDVVHVSSLFEGIGHDAVTSIGTAEPDVLTAVTLYDLIPLLNPDQYLGDGRVRDWYMRKLESLRRADMLLAISHSSASEAASALRVPRDRIRVIGAGVDPSFRPVTLDEGGRAMLRLRYGLTRGFVLYTGGGDPRKNLAALLDAFSRLVPALRDRLQLAVIGELGEDEARALRAKAGELGLSADELRLLGYVSDADLASLYTLCDAFVFPSLHEGFGLPAAEAMACGAPVIGSNTSSVPEIIDRPEALFDPRDPADIARCLTAVLSDDHLRARLKEHGAARGRAFSWEAVAAKALDALEACERPASRAPRRRAAPGRPRLTCVAPERHAFATRLLRGLADHYDVTFVTDGAARSRPEDGIAREDGAWFRRNAGRHDRVLHIVDDALGAGVSDLFQACPGTIVLCRGTQPAEDSHRAVETLYAAHGLSAAMAAERDGLAQAARRFPPVGDLMSLAQGVIVQSQEAADAIAARYGPEAAARAVRVLLDGERPARAEAYRDAIEHFAADADRSRFRRVTAQLASLPGTPKPSRDDWERTASSLAANMAWFSPKQILVDITLMVTADVGTGIQRVTRNIASELIASPPPGYKVELVRMSGTGFVYARRYAERFLGLEQPLPEDEPVALRRGDVFLGLDLNMGTPGIRPWFEAARRDGACVLFVVYDLLPATMPEMFGPEIQPLYRGWLSTLIDVADGLLCISRSVADELRRWIDAHETDRREPLRIGWFHQGTNLSTGAPAHPPTPEQQKALDVIRAGRSVLTVGTIEPRKGYGQVLAAFEVLWDRGLDIALVIVGKQGWLVEALVARLEAHQERGRRLFWFSSVSDALLAQLYQGAKLLLAASVGEGFGLPLVEAQQFNLPVLARDIPVFREVLGGNATYFDAQHPQGLADALEAWFHAGQRVGAGGPTRAVLGWRESASQLVRHLHGDAWYLTRTEGAGGRSEWRVSEDQY